MTILYSARAPRGPGGPFFAGSRGSKVPPLVPGAGMHQKGICLGLRARVQNLGVGVLTGTENLLQFVTITVVAVAAAVVAVRKPSPKIPKISGF